MAVGTQLQQLDSVMRVAFVSFDFGEYCVRIASALARHADVRLLLPKHEAEPYLHLLERPVSLRTFAKPRLRHALRQARTVAALIEDIRRFRPDVVHLQAGHLWFNMALPLLRGYPLVLTVHDPSRHLGDKGARNTPQWLLDFGCRQATRLIVHAPQLKQMLLERLPVLENRIDVVPHVSLGDDTAQQDVPEDGHQILFFGRIWPYKGLDYLIRAEPMITARVPEVKIVIAGTGENFARYRAMMSHPDQFIIHYEYVSDEKRANLFRQASIIVLPYVEASQSGVIALAYRFGKPVVATTVGGLPAMVDHGQTGLLIPPCDPQALAEALVKLLETPELRRQMGANARRKVDVECAPEVVVDQTLPVYRAAIKATERLGERAQSDDSPQGSDMTDFQTVLRLHRYMMDTQWNGTALIGPDVGIRFNWRIGRFVKSYLSAIPWNDSYYYLQAQGYWVLANWLLFQKTSEPAYREIAIRSAESMLERQRSDGAWDYPHPEWSGRVTTAEGTWGSLGLLETYRHTGDCSFLNGALRWHRFLLNRVGFEQAGDELSVNYFSNVSTARVPNNSAFVLRFLSELADVTGNQDYLYLCRGLVTFMTHAQKPNGEFPYMVRGSLPHRKCWEHFQCYQYNAFECLDLMRYQEITGDATVVPVIFRCLSFLRDGLAADGHAYYDCGNRYRQVTYHAAALGAAFSMAERHGFYAHEGLAERAFSYLLGIQRSDGAFPFSRGDYRSLSDRRPYPRVLAMILFHLLIRLDHVRGKCQVS
jgi:glycosyltransferase involved in cell wall biosynthesis